MPPPDRQQRFSPPSLCIARADNDLLFDEAGRSYIDLFSGHGATWLGHCNPHIAAVVREQMDKVWLTGALPTPMLAEAHTRIESFFPSTHRLAMLYSTGMEAAEFALRVARVVTGKSGAVGFERCMHGKSLATAYLAWDNHDGVDLPFFQRLPFIPHCDEDDILARLDRILERGATSAVFVEPLQGSGGGHAGSPRFYQEIARRCAAHGVLLVFDEVMTGFYRTGPLFYFSDLGFTPDVVLIGKALGNGFPVSGVVVHEQYPLRKEMLPGSTFSGNPLAAAAVVGTLRQLSTFDLPTKVAAIDETIRTHFAPLAQWGIGIRGRGALWALEVPPGADVEALVVRIYQAGVAVGYAGRFLRITPAATIEPAHLERGCSVVRDSLLRECGDR